MMKLHSADSPYFSLFLKLKLKEWVDGGAEGSGKEHQGNH